MAQVIPAPPRFQHRSLAEYVGIIVVLALVVTSVVNTAPSLDKLQRGTARLFAPSGFLMQMFPPDFSRVEHITWKLVETLQMAVAGAALGLGLGGRGNLDHLRRRKAFDSGEGRQVASDASCETRWRAMDPGNQRKESQRSDSVDAGDGRRGMDRLRPIERGTSLT